MPISDNMLNSLASQSLEWENEHVPYFPQPDTRYQQGDHALQLLLAARIALGNAVSYRKFNVAASGLVVTDEPRVGRLMGFNVKLDNSDLINIHAEDVVLKKALTKKYARIPMLAIIGPVQADSQSGRPSPTLHPCGRCRDTMAEDPLIDSETLVISATPDMRVVEFGSFHEYVSFHKTGKSTLREARFLEQFDLFAPLPEPGSVKYVEESPFVLRA